MFQAHGEFLQYFNPMQPQYYQVIPTPAGRYVVKNADSVDGSNRIARRSGLLRAEAGTGRVVLSPRPFPRLRRPSFASLRTGFS